MTKFLNVALPKGRLGEKVYAMFERAGFECPSIKENNRKLVFENAEKQVRYFWVKPSDVAIYVEHGAADIGVAGTYKPALSTGMIFCPVTIPSFSFMIKLFLTCLL